MTRLIYLRDDKHIYRDLNFLLKNDPVFSSLEIKAKDFDRKLSPLSFAAMVKTIAGQQISISAAASVYQRLKDMCGGHVTAQRILNLKDSQIRQAGFSAQKITYVKGLALTVLQKEFSFKTLRDMSDEDVIHTITTLKGFGVWSAHMMLIFTLHRRDIWPSGDLGVQIGAGHYLKRDKLSVREMEDFGERFKGRRTAATLLLWRLKSHRDALKKLKR